MNNFVLSLNKNLSVDIQPEKIFEPNYEQIPKQIAKFSCLVMQGGALRNKLEQYKDKHILGKRWHCPHPICWRCMKHKQAKFGPRCAKNNHPTLKFMPCYFHKVGPCMKTTAFVIVFLIHENFM